jgi:thioredoxin reductase (NADPH)
MQFADLVIVGAGPAGLSAAMNSASEGISTVVIEAEDKVGGQAKHSSRIENYLGFPNGLTGPQLMSRAYTQAKRFGAKFITGVNATGLTIDGHYRTVSLSNDSKIIGKAVLLAQGLQWRKLEAPGVEEYIHKGVFYGLNMDSAYEFKDKKVTVVGGANSAGQAALWLAKFAERVSLVVRSTSLGTNLSAYLLARIEQTKNITVLLDSEVTSATGNGEVLQSITINSHALPSEDKATTVKTDGLFVFIGAIPRTAWLQGACELDSLGFINTSDYQTSCLGVFAAGDIRSGSVKRIAASAGEGSMVVSRIHAYIATLGV